MRECCLLALIALAANCQIVDIATNPDASILLFKSQFRLQSEPFLKSEQKIYRWSAGKWDRLGVESPQGGFVAGGIFRPFVLGDGSIYGWEVLPSRGLFPPVPIYAQMEVVGLTLPSDFPRGSLRISANGRFVTGSAPNRAPELLDLESGSRTILPSDLFRMQPASDGTVLFLRSTGLYLRSPAGTERQISTLSNIENIAISDDGRWVAYEAKAVLFVARGSELTELDILVPPRKTNHWSLSNSRLVYLAPDGRLRSFDLETKTVSVAAEPLEAFEEVVLGTHGNFGWAVEESNRLWRLDLAKREQTQIAPPLGHAEGGAFDKIRGPRVPGSAVLLTGIFTRGQKAIVEGEEWPVSDVNADGLWVQVPWELQPTSQGRLLAIRNNGNPFEDLSIVFSDGEYLPAFATHPSKAAPGGLIAIAAHEDFHGVVTDQDPALEGELLHLYMTGLGALERTLATGERGPAEGVRIQRTLSCSGGSSIAAEQTPVEVLQAVFAPGMLGIYQVEMRVPAGVPDGLWVLRCGDAPRSASGYVFTKPGRTVVEQWP